MNDLLPFYWAGKIQPNISAKTTLDIVACGCHALKVAERNDDEAIRYRKVFRTSPHLSFASSSCPESISRYVFLTEEVDISCRRCSLALQISIVYEIYFVLLLVEKITKT